MTEEKLKIANELSERIRRLSLELSRWETSLKILSIKIRGLRSTTDIQNEDSFYDIKPIKEFIIKDLSEKLEAAKLEFEKL